MAKKEPLWPSPIDKIAYHGVVGEYLRAIEPHTEGDPAAILIQTLVCVGNAMGRNPHFMVEDTRHGTNLFAAIVGKTSSARKGTSFDRAQKLIRLAEPTWGRNNDGDGGLSSSEGLIGAVQDQHDDADTESVTDKRLLAAMGEFAETLTKMRREGNTLSATLRQAWDGKTLRVRTRHHPMTAADAHVSVIGHITQADLHALLGDTSIFNGFGNRFLWVMAKQSQELPFGGELRVESLDRIVSEVRKSIRWCLSKGRNIDFDPRTRRMWPDLYSGLNRRPDNAFGAITDRAVAQVRRIALVYAALDRSPKIRRPHLEAALEVWRYCEYSAAYLFADVPGNPVDTTILRVLEGQRHWLAHSRLSREGFKGNVPSSALNSALDRLSAQGLIERRRVDTSGRPRTEYRICQ
jgi:plasmid stabilization system protein ParE